MMNFDKFLDEIKKLSNENEDSKSFSFIKTIDWKFMNLNNDMDIDRFVTVYGDFVVVISHNEVYVPKLCEIIVRYLYPNPPPNKIIKNFKPFFLLIWYLFFNNPSIRDELELAIFHLFPHFLGGSIENIGCYVENVLELVYLNHFEETNPLYKYDKCNEYFVKEMQYFVLSKLVEYITGFDSQLVLEKLQQQEVNKLPDVQAQIVKLDRIMCLFFQYMNKYSHDSKGELIWSNAEDLLKKIKRIYRDKIMICNLKRSFLHVHYILAYVTSLHPALSKHMCEYFWTLASDLHQPSNIRCGAIRSLTGYAAKFNFINTGLVINILDEMFTWCDRYLEDNSVAEKDIDKYSEFYSMANGGLFILMHRHKEIIDYFGDISVFSGFSEAWQLSYLTSHKANVLREYPFREQLPKLCKLFHTCYLGYINTIVDERIVRKPKPTLFEGMPFRYNFLPDSMEFLSQYRVSGETRPELI